MRARAVVLRNENEGRFHQLCDLLEAEWQPQTPTELALLEKMAISQWKLVRAERREAIICEVYTDEKQEAMLAPLAKFQERFDRAFFRALRELEKLQKIRRKRPHRPSKKPRPLLPSRDRQGAVPRLNRGTLWVRRRLPQTRRISPTPCPPSRPRPPNPIP